MLADFLPTILTPLVTGTEQLSADPGASPQVWPLWGDSGHQLVGGRAARKADVIAARGDR